MTRISPISQEPRRTSYMSFIGSAAGITASVLACAKKKNISPLKINYSKLDVLKIGASSCAGGMIGGLLSDFNLKPKLREGIQQYLGNMFIPVSFLALVDSLKLKGLTRIGGILLALFGGMKVGNTVIEKVNNRVFKEVKPHEIEPEDYLVHVDDLCLASKMLVKKNCALCEITNKILPFSFIIAGYKTGKST